MDKRIWLGAALMVTVLFGSFFLIARQSLRSAANDPQISMAQDAAIAIAQDRQPASLLAGKIDAAYETSPFIIVYDRLGNVVAGNGHVHGQTPHMPLSVLERAPDNEGVHAITWEPSAGVRIASVSARAGDYYIVGGRSLATTESRIRSAALYTACAWLLTMATLTALYVIVHHKPKAV